MANLTIENHYREKMKDRLYGLLKEREKNGEWEKFLDTILIELIGYNDTNMEYCILYSKLASCKYLSYKYYRKTIFECMNLLDRIDAQ